MLPLVELHQFVRVQRRHGLEDDVIEHGSVLLPRPHTGLNQAGAATAPCEPVLPDSPFLQLKIEA